MISALRTIKSDRKQLLLVWGVVKLLGAERGFGPAGSGVVGGEGGEGESLTRYRAQWLQRGRGREGGKGCCSPSLPDSSSECAFPAGSPPSDISLSEIGIVHPRRVWVVARLKA